MGDELVDGAVARAAVELAVELVRIDSVNPGLSPGATGEGPIVAMLRHRLEERGFAVEVVTAPDAPDRPSLLARHTGSGGGRTLLLNGHLDTVGTDGMVAPFAGETIDRHRVGGRLLGRGACDMKAGVAAMVVAAERAAAEGTAGDVVLALVADEEDASLGTEAVLAHLDADSRRVDACLVGEPTWLDLGVAHRGYALLDVGFTGRAAHSSQPDQGVNAVTHLGRFLGAVEDLHRDVSKGDPHPLLDTGSVLATVAGGGQSPFVLAPSASAIVERRTLPGEDAAGARSEVETALAGLQRADPTLDSRIEVSLARAAWEHDPDSPAGDLAGMLAEALTERTGTAPERVGLPYWMESALFEEAGIPTIVCGPAGGGLHSEDEWVDLDQVRVYAEALAQVITRFCGP